MKSFFSFDRDVKVLLPNGDTHPLTAYLLPSTFLMLASLLLVTSMFLPYWKITLFAPQYPNGLQVSVFVNRLEGDVREVDELNHYLGMPPLDRGGRLERKIAQALILFLGFLLMANVFIHNQWAGILALPAMAFPFLFLIDLKIILYRFGHSIDPNSPLGGAVKPFTPRLFGEGHIGQFRTIASTEAGLYLAAASVLVLLISLWLHRKAYKPIVEARQQLKEPREKK